MKRIIFFILICVLIQFSAQAQGNNPCGKSWSEWRTGWNFSYGRVLFRLEFPSKSCGCGYNFVQMQHNIPNRARVTMRLEGVDCDGKKYGENFSKEINGGEISPSGAEYHWFKSMPTVVKVEIDFEDGKNRIKLVGDQSGSKTYINGMTEQAYKQQQQQQQQKAATNASTSSSSSGGGTNRNSGNGSNASSGSSGTTARTTGSTTRSTTTANKPKSPAPDPAAAQKNIYKNTALADLQRSQQSTQSPIVQQMHLSNAMITAQASGDVATIRQVQQMQAQATAQNQQRLTESVTGLVGSTFNLISAIQNEKREKEAARQRWDDAYNERKRYEAIKIAEIEQETAPQKQRSLEQLQKGMAEASDGYGKSVSDADKLLHALSWLWKWRESEKILNGKPEVKASYYKASDVSVLSKGYINAPPHSLIPARSLQQMLDLQVLPSIVNLSVETNKLIYPLDLPYKAEKTFNKKLNFFYGRSSDKIPIPEQIDRAYNLIDFKIGLYRSITTNPEKIKEAIDRTNYIDRYSKQYNPDSAACVNDGKKLYRYWNGKGWKKMYRAGFVPQKKLEGNLLRAGYWLDSAIVFNRADALPRAAAKYQETFDWYFSGPVRWLKPETQPAVFIRESMWRYALAVAAARKNQPTTANGDDPHAAMTEAFIKHFEQYCQLDLSRVTKPLKFNDYDVVK